MIALFGKVFEQSVEILVIKKIDLLHISRLIFVYPSVKWFCVCFVYVLLNYYVHLWRFFGPL